MESKAVYPIKVPDGMPGQASNGRFRVLRNEEEERQWLQECYEFGKKHPELEGHPVPNTSMRLTPEEYMKAYKEMRRG